MAIPVRRLRPPPSGRFAEICSTAFILLVQVHEHAHQDDELT